MEKVQDDQFITIHGWMRTRLGLTTNELFLYALIYGYNWASKKEFYGSIKYMQEWLGIGSDKTIRTALKKLCDKQLILRRQQFTDAGLRVYYRVNQQMLPLTDGTPNPRWAALRTTNNAPVLPRIEAAAAELALPTPLEVKESLQKLPTASVNITDEYVQNLPDDVVENDSSATQKLPRNSVESTYNNNNKIDNQNDNKITIKKEKSEASLSGKEKITSQEEVAVKAEAPTIDYGQLISDYDASTEGKFMHRLLYNETKRYIRDKKSIFADVDADF